MKAQLFTGGIALLALTAAAQTELLSDEQVKAVLQERLQSKTVEDARVIGVVINADHKDSSGWHTWNVRDFYQAWKQRGFDDHHLFVFATENVRPEAVVTNQLLINARPTKNNLIHLFGHLRITARNRDTCYIYLTGHGRRSGNETFLALDDMDLSGSELVRYLDGMKRRGSRFLVIADHCYSGGMLDRMKTSQLDFVFVCDTDAENPVACRPFMRRFWAAFRQEGASLLDAFKTAQADLSPQEIANAGLQPIYYSSGD